MDDHKIVIYTKINNKGALKDLATLKEQAKSAAKKVEELGKEKAGLDKDNGRLSAELAKAKGKAAETAKALRDAQDAARKAAVEFQKMQAARAKNPEQAASDFPTWEEVFGDIFAGGPKSNTSAAEGKSVKELQKEADAAQKALSKITAKLDGLNQKKLGLTQQLEGAKKAAEDAEAAVQQAGLAYDDKFQRVVSGLSRDRKYNSLTPEQQGAYAERKTKAMYPDTTAAYTDAQKNADAAQAAVEKLTAAYADLEKQIHAVEAEQENASYDAAEKAAASTQAAADEAQTANNAAQASVDSWTDALGRNEAETRTVEGAQSRVKGVLDEVSDALDAATASSARIARVMAISSAMNAGFKAVLSGAVRMSKYIQATLTKINRKIRSFVSGLLKGNKYTNMLAGRMRRLLVSALIFNSITRAVNSLTNTIGTALNQNKAYASSMANLKGAAYQLAVPLTSMLAPALTMVANAAATAIGYLAKLFSFFSGKTVSQTQKEAAALGSVGSSAGKASKSLAGFDTINQLSSGSSGSGGSSESGTIAPNYEFDPQNDFLDKMLETIEAGDWAGAGKMLAEKLNEIVDSWDAYAWGQRLGEKIQHGIDFAFNFIVNFDWAGLGERLADYVNGVFSMIDPYELGALLLAPFTIAFQTLGGFLANLDWAQLGVDFSLLVQGMLDSITLAMSNVDWSSIGGGIATFLQNIDWAGVAASLWKAIERAFSSFDELLTGFFQQLFGDEVGEQIADIITKLTKVIAVIMLVTTAIGIVAAVVAALTSPIGLVILAIAAAILIWTQLKDTFVAFAEVVAEKMIAFGDALIGVFESIVNGVKNMVNSVISFVNGMISAIVAGINYVIDAINELSWDFPDWLPVVGGKKFGFNIANISAPQIPLLAQGAVIPPNKEFMAVLGDQRSGTNVEAPLSTIEQAVRNVVGQQQVTVKFTGNLAQLGRVLRPVIETENRRKGSSLVVGGTL